MTTTIAATIADIAARLDRIESMLAELTGKKEDALEESQSIMDALEHAAATRNSWQRAANSTDAEMLEIAERKAWFERALAELRQILATLKKKTGVMAAWFKLIDAADLVAQCNPRLENQVWKTVEAARA